MRVCHLSVLVINGKALCKRNNIDYYQRLTLESWFTNLNATES